MKIEQITIRSFGLLRNYQESFSDGVNIVEGGNETGKSTIAAYIRYMLYGFPDEVGILSERERRINWTTGTADGSMTLTSGGVRYRIDRKTERVRIGDRMTYVDTCELYEVETNTPVVLKTTPGEYLLGVGQALFESTAYLGQLADTGENPDVVRQSIENLLFSGDEKVNTGRAITTLTQTGEALLSQDKTHGRLSEVRSRATALSSRLANAIRGQKTLLVKKKELDENIAHRDEARRCYENLQELKVCHSNFQIFSSFTQLHAMEQQAQDIATEAETYRAANTYMSFFPDEAYAADVATKRRIWADTQSRFEEAERVQRELESKQIFTRETQKNLQRADRYGGEAQVLSRYQEVNKRFRGMLLASMLTVTAFLLIAILGGMGMFHSAIGGGWMAAWIVGCALTFVASIVLFIITINRHEAQRVYCLDYGAKNGKELFYRMKMVSECREASAAHIEELRIARERADSARTAYFSARNVLDETLGKWGKTLPPTGDAREFMDVFEGSIRDTIQTYRGMCDRKAALDGAIEALATSLSAFREEEIAALVPESRRAALAETTPEQIDEGIQYYEGQHHFFAETVSRLTEDFESLSSTTEHPAELGEQLAATEAEYQQLKRRYDAIEEALASLTGADIRLRAELSPRLAHYARELMDVMTDGKYDGMTVTDDLRLEYRDGTDIRSVEMLSGGTRDIAYIALRLALIRLLYRETPPLCFDESFAHQDNDRCYSMLKVFLALSQRNGQQTILFTCRSREYTIASEIGGNCHRIQMI